MVMFLVWIVEVFVMGILHSFVNNNSNHRMCCSSIGIGIRKENVYLYEFGRDIERYW